MPAQGLVQVVLVSHAGGDGGSRRESLHTRPSRGDAVVPPDRRPCVRDSMAQVSVCVKEGRGGPGEAGPPVRWSDSSPGWCEHHSALLAV